jgi:hypothetical protein
MPGVVATDRDLMFVDVVPCCPPKWPGNRLARVMRMKGLEPLGAGLLRPPRRVDAPLPDL